MKAKRVVNVYLYTFFNPLNAELNPICHFLTLLGAHSILYVSRIRVNLGYRWGEWSTSRPGRFTYWKENWHPLYMKLGGLQGRAGRVIVTFSCRRKST